MNEKLEIHFRESIKNKDRATRKEDFESIKEIKFIPYLSFYVVITSFVWAIWSFIPNFKIDLIVKFISLATNGSKSDNMEVFNAVIDFLSNKLHNFVQFMFISVFLVISIYICMNYYYKLKKISYYRYVYIDNFRVKKRDAFGKPVYDENLPFKEHESND